MVDPSAGRASSHLSLSVAFKGLSAACKTEPRPGKKDAMAPLWLYFTYFNGTSVVEWVTITPPLFSVLLWGVLGHNQADHEFSSKKNKTMKELKDNKD